MGYNNLWCSLSQSEGSFRFADVTGFTVVACQLLYYTTCVLGMVLVFWGH